MGRLRLRLLSVFVIAAVLGSAPAEAGDGDVTVDDVIRLVQSGISDETILAFLETKQIGFTVDADVILRLRSAGVSETVIRSLLARARPTPAPPPTYAAPTAPLYGYPVPYPPAYYVYPRVYYAAPVSVVFSFGLPHLGHGRAFFRHHRRDVVTRHFPVATRHFPVTARHFPVTASHFPVTASHFPVAASHFAVAASHFPIAARQFSIVGGHRTFAVGHVHHAGRHVHRGHGSHRHHR